MAHIKPTFCWFKEQKGQRSSQTKLCQKLVLLCGHVLAYRSTQICRLCTCQLPNRGPGQCHWCRPITKCVVYDKKSWRAWMGRLWPDAHGPGPGWTETVTPCMARLGPGGTIDHTGRLSSPKKPECMALYKMYM